MRSGCLIEAPVCTHKQHVVVAGILRFDVMHVVGNHQSHFVPAGPVQQRLVDLAQGRDVVLLKLDEEAILAEDVYIPLQTFQSQLGLLFGTLGAEQGGHLGSQTAGGADQALAVRGEVIGVDARAVVIAAHLRRGADLQQVLVAGLVLSQQQQMMAVLIQRRVAALH